MSNKQPPVLPVPWNHKPGSVASSWSWDTPHFTVTIFAEGMSSRPMFNWKISDKTSGFTKTFDTGMDLSFNQAVDNVLEIIGKSYPRTLGYQAYAGPLATTFMISDGKKYDFATAIGENVIMKVLSPPDNRLITLTGVFDISNYDFSLTQGDGLLLISPTQVVDVLQEFGNSSYIKFDGAQPSRSSTGRIVYEPWQKGCTGRPGFRPGTTIHPPGAEYCSIHGV